MYYEDNFYEPSEFDIKVEEFKEELRKSIKQEFQDKLDEANRTIEELKEYRDNKNAYENALNIAKRDVDRLQRTALEEAKKLRVSNLLNDLSQPAWKVTYKTVYIKDKCDKCDEKRQIHFKSPSGKDLVEDCECSKKKLIYKPCPAKCVRFYTERDKITEADFVGWVETRKENLEYPPASGRWELVDDGNYAHIKYTGQKLNELNDGLKYSYYFFNEEDCQKYCDYLNTPRKDE